MQVIWDIHRIHVPVESVITLGTFDGIHRGHQCIIERIVQCGHENGLKATLVTFEPPPPLVVKNSDRAFAGILTTIDEKIKILEKLGLERLVIVNFTSSFAALTAEVFVLEKLVAKLGMKKIIVGRDHAFGRNREGNIELLNRLAKAHQFTVEELAPIATATGKISSTQIRHLLLHGHLKEASHLLGRPYSIQGQVIAGNGKGRSLGFPTANIKPFSQYKLVPKQGIYATRFHLAERTLNSVTYIGVRPTFHLTEKVIEIHIPDFVGELYGRNVEVDFIDFIRDDETFANQDDLVKQIKNDKMKSLELLKNF